MKLREQINQVSNHKSEFSDDLKKEFEENHDILYKQIEEVEKEADV